MEYRKYKAKTFQEAKLKMLLDVGNRAYIISQKKVKVGGLFGLFGKPMIEITAGVMEHSAMAKKTASTNQPVENISRPIENNHPVSNQPEHVNVQQTVHTHDYNQAQQPMPNKENNGQIRAELDELKSLITKILVDQQTTPNPTDTPPLQQNTPQNANNGKDEKTKDLIKMFLKNEDFDENFINTLCSLSSVEFGIAGETDLSRIKDHLKKQIFDTFEISKGINLDDNKMNILVLVGPTGVGKTTTLAKLGAYFGVFQKKKVKFISIDTYRVGAIQQLKLYADIMEIPFAKVNSVEELKMEVYSDEYDLVLVDTTGRNQKNLDEIRDIKNYIEILQGKLHLSLVISATTKYKDLVEILDKFDILNYTNIIVTKLDETNTLGQVISAISPKKRTLSYITFGQSVPEDIEEASKEKLSEMVLKT